MGHDNACMGSSRKLAKTINICPSGFIADKIDCVGASVSLGGQLRRGLKISRSVAYAPYGCSIQGGWYIHWNQNCKFRMYFWKMLMDS